MNIQVITDIHMNVKRAEPFEWFVRPAADVLVIAGDLYPIKYLDDMKGRVADFFMYLHDNWRQIIWVPGNHDYKGMVYRDPRMDRMKETFGNITIANNATVDVDEVRFLCTTLWTHIPPQHEMKVKNYLHDFKEIGNFNPLHYNRLNATCVEWLRWAVDDADYRRQKTVVVTHHLPMWHVVSHPYRNADETYGFANTGLDDIVEKYDVAAWIYGHSHDYREDEAFGTLLIRNPVGYPNQRGTTNCDPEKVITI